MRIYISLTMFGFRFELDVTRRRFAFSVEVLDSTDSSIEEDGVKLLGYLIA